MHLRTTTECLAPHVHHPAVAFAEGYQLKATGWTAGLPAWRDDPRKGINFRSIHGMTTSEPTQCVNLDERGSSSEAPVECRSLGPNSVLCHVQSAIAAAPTAP